jgi:DNA (cytosine-5)-methyltransferase 1
MKQLSLSLDLPNQTESQNQNWFHNILSTLDIKLEPGWPDRFGKSLRKYLQKHGISPVKTLSLFSGGGGLDIAFHDAGFDIVQMVELEAKYVQTLQQNAQDGKWLENSQIICTDIRDYIPDPNLDIDFVIGGPPCQTFSAAGRRAAGVCGTTDAKGRLFEEYVRILKVLQPQGFLFENVYGLTGAEAGEAWKGIQEAFREVGYSIYFRILDAADYGVPQHRERLFIIGLKQGTYLFPYPTHGPDSLNNQPYYSAGEAVENADSLGIEVGIGGKFGHLLEDIPPGLNYSFYTKEMGYPQPIFSWRSKFSDYLYKADPDTPVRTIKAQGGQYTGPFSWENRKFSIAELKRLQTIPDDYEIVGNRQVAVEQIGNSVPPQLGRILALSILDRVFQKELPFSLAYLSQEKKLGFRKRKKQLRQVYFQKAQTAIQKLVNRGKIIGLSNTYQDKGKSIRFLSPVTFLWSQEAISDSIKIYINYELNQSCWIIAASLQNDWDKPDRFAIDIYPSWEEEWDIGTKSVKLCAKNLDTKMVTSLWKAFEEKLNEATGKVDLVQLSGYYQYSPRIHGIMSFYTASRIGSFWYVVQCVTRGIGVATQLKTRQLSRKWGVEDDRIFSHLQSLKALGYEVRSHNTNPQIPVDEYLIPYAFPTLHPKSVQLHKTL